MIENSPPPRFWYFPKTYQARCQDGWSTFLWQKLHFYVNRTHSAQKGTHSEWNKKSSGICIALLQLLQFQQRFWCKGKISKRDIVVIKSHVIFPGHGSQKCHTFFVLFLKDKHGPVHRELLSIIKTKNLTTWRFSHIFCVWVKKIQSHINFFQHALPLVCLLWQ